MLGRLGLDFGKAAHFPLAEVDFAQGGVVRQAAARRQRIGGGHGAGDVVLIAGKGHETYQESHGVRTPFDDRHEARQAMMARAPARRE